MSTDLVSWEVLPEALGPTPGSWDDLSIWTGSTVLGDDGVWRMFYTATSMRGYGVRDQRVGLAESDDLVTWRKIGTSPLLVADPLWYRTLPEDVTASETWRDPQVFRDPDGDGWHMLVTARSLTHGPDDDGVLAHARSHDLRDWELGPPVCESGCGFGQLEVAQVRQIEGRWVLVFVQRRDGSWVLVGFLNNEPKGELSFHITDPIPVGLDEHGTLTALSSCPVAVTTTDGTPPAGRCPR